MKFNFTRRDVKFFVLGILTAFILSAIFNWEDTVEAFHEGYSQGRQSNPLAQLTLEERE